MTSIVILQKNKSKCFFYFFSQCIVVACCCVIIRKDTDTYPDPDAAEMDNRVVCSRRKSIHITAASVSCPKNFVRSGQNANKLEVFENPFESGG